MRAAMNSTQTRLLAFIAELELQHGRAHPRVRSMAGALGVSEATVHRALRTLRAANLLKISKRRARSGKQLTSVYTLTAAGKAVVNAATPLSHQQAALAAFYTEETPGGVSPKTATGVSGVSPNQATGVSPDNPQETPTQTSQIGGEGVTKNNDTPVRMTPLNKEHQEPAGGGPDPAAPEGRPQRPQPRLTGIPEVDSYILRKHKERENAPPDPYAWMHERHAQKLHEQHLAIMANRNKADA